MKQVPVFKGVPPKVPTPAPPTMFPAVPPLMDLREAAKWLRASPRFVSKEVQQERLRAVKIGRLRRFEMKDLVEYVEARKSGGLVPIVEPKPLRPVSPENANP